IAEQENKQALEAIRKNGKTEIYTLTAAEKAEWRKALLPVRKDVEGRVGKEVLNAVDKESAALGIK
ncbi:MAG: C4-dicarboxylate transporter, partial [Burkholderia sp.]|nr:C4-dicarboxylate transporter [Burkholderia sp.]